MGVDHPMQKGASFLLYVVWLKLGWTHHKPSSVPLLCVGVVGMLVGHIKVDFLCVTFLLCVFTVHRSKHLLLIFGVGTCRSVAYNTRGSVVGPVRRHMKVGCDTLLDRYDVSWGS